MADTYQRIAAVQPTDTNEADLYPLTSGSIIGVIHVCNQDSSERTFRVAVTDAGTGVAASVEDWIEYDTTIPANTTYKVTIEGMSATSTIRIKASVADKLSFVLMGVIIT